MEINLRNYYRIYDDQGEENFFKTKLTQEEVDKLLKEFETTHQEYYNNDFFNYVKEHDPEAALISIKSIYY